MSNKDRKARKREGQKFTRSEKVKNSTIPSQRPSGRSYLNPEVMADIVAMTSWPPRNF